jgi:two-component sensor histidine kinase
VILWPSAASVWRLWWAGDSLGILIVAPVLVTWVHRPRLGWQGLRLLEFATYLAVTTLIGLAVFVWPTGGNPFFYPRAYVAFPLLAWAGLRLGSREAAVGVAILATFAVWGSVNGFGPFSRWAPDARLVLLDTFIATAACTALLIAAVIAERQGAQAVARESEDRLQGAYTELEERVRARTAELAAAVEELGQRNREKEILLREIHHRVKNNLQVVCSLLNLQAHGQEEPRLLAFAAGCRARVRSMALVHEHLYRSNNLQSVPVTVYVGALLEEVVHSHPTAAPVVCDVNIQDLVLSIDQAIPCGLIINELVTNALKHAFPAGGPGRVTVSIVEIPVDRIELVVADDGIGSRGSRGLPSGTGFGLSLVSMLADQLHGTLDIGHAQGTRVMVRFARRRH